MVSTLRIGSGLRNLWGVLPPCQAKRRFIAGIECNGLSACHYPWIDFSLLFPALSGYLIYGRDGRELYPVGQGRQSKSLLY